MRAIDVLLRLTVQGLDEEMLGTSEVFAWRRRCRDREIYLRSISTTPMDSVRNER